MHIYIPTGTRPRGLQLQWPTGRHRNHAQQRHLAQRGHRRLRRLLPHPQVALLHAQQDPPQAAPLAPNPHAHLRPHRPRRRVRAHQAGLRPALDARGQAERRGRVPERLLRPRLLPRDHGRVGAHSGRGPRPPRRHSVRGHRGGDAHRRAACAGRPGQLGLGRQVDPAGGPSVVPRLGLQDRAGRQGLWQGAAAADDLRQLAGLLGRHEGHVRAGDDDADREYMNG